MNASAPGIGNRISRMLEGLGCDITPMSVCEDLGAATVGGHYRTLSSINKRIAKGHKRALGVANLVRTDKAARKLYITGVNPMQAYDLPTMGPSPAIIKRLRRNALTALSPPGFRQCPTSTINWFIGQQNDPQVREPLRQVMMWYDIRSELVKRDLHR